MDEDWVYPKFTRIVYHLSDKLDGRKTTLVVFLSGMRRPNLEFL
jgi:hypothetical protein